jgi:DNA-binding transcriptional ArsR family regulator
MSDESRLPDIQKKIPYPFTAVPNSYLDEWMRTLGKKPNAKLTMIYIFRRTVGWEGRPIEAAITLKEFREFIGIEHDATVETALAVLKDTGLITMRQEGGSKSVKIYRLTPKAFQSAKFADSAAAASAKIEDTNPQNLQIGTAKNRRNSSAKIAEATSLQPAQEEAPTEAKEKKEKEKENEKRAWQLRMQIGKLEDDLGKLRHSKLRTWAGKTERQFQDEIQTLRATLSELEAGEDESAPCKDESEG